MTLIAAALRDHYLNPRNFAEDAQNGQDTEE
jgi:hypothetical protein